MGSSPPAKPRGLSAAQRTAATPPGIAERPRALGKGLVQPVGRAHLGLELLYRELVAGEVLGEPQLAGVAEDPEEMPHVGVLEEGSVGARLLRRAEGPLAFPTVMGEPSPTDQAEPARVEAGTERAARPPEDPGPSRRSWASPASEPEDRDDRPAEPPAS